MRLVTFVPRDAPDEVPHLGAMLDDEHLLDLNDASGGQLPTDVAGFLAAGAPALARARSLVADAGADTESIFTTAAVRLLAPVPRPGKIIALARNYADHAAEGGAVPPDKPTIFAKFSNSVVGPYDDIVLPRVSEQIDYEAELVAVIGTRCYQVDEADALQYVGGYTIANDVSVRDYQRMTTQFTLGKTFDTHCPMGPAVLTADEAGDPQAMHITTTINGEVLQDASTADMVFSVAHLVAFLSAVMTLEPGDVILTGTPGGVGAWRKPPRWIRDGEVVRIEIAGIGHIENKAVAESARSGAA
ncbi:MAG TPA: fumarylacetoacetate hydrolase family protein [Steroidobacteraceae bacterium]|jgi:acylpyruvate hydrolase